MFKLFAGNVLGIVLAAVWAGYAWPSGHLPVMAMVASVLFLIAMVLPFWFQHRALENSFAALTAGQQDSRRDRRPGEAEVFTDAPPPPVFQRARLHRKLVLAMTMLAALLLIGDAVTFFVNKPPGPTNRGVISNF